MTAEISIMNRNAVALAADSAVTLQLPEGPKIYHTNKLFSLSKYEPVGVMVYGSADFMRVPWETVIKRYRAELGRHAYRQLDGYANSFLDYIEHCSPATGRENQELFCYTFIRSWLNNLRLGFEQLIEHEMQSGPVTETKVKQLFLAVIQLHAELVEKQSRLGRFSSVTTGRILAAYKSQIRAAIRDELEGLAKIAPANQLERICASVFLRKTPWNHESGVVVAGFGTSQFYPSLRAYNVDGVIADKLRFSENLAKRTDIGKTDDAAVIPFAQSEMVSLFMDGIDSDFRAALGVAFEEILVSGYPTVIDRNFGKYFPKTQRNRIVRKLRKAGTEAVNHLGNWLRSYSKSVHSDPIVEIATHLPKEELAAMAEALVNLTSFKRHVTRQAETVGGPIDVAVISRGDGFIWIKRKHYFKVELNRHFMTNYYYDTQHARSPRKRTL